MGNNMLITREAYDKVGGFAGIPFSLTEDFEMARSLKNIGFKGIHQVSAANLVQTKAQLDFPSLLSQRKRWMAGAFSLPPYWKVLLGLQVLFFPAIVISIGFFPIIGVSMWVLKIIFQSRFISRFAACAGEKLNYFELLLFEIYYMITAWSTIVYYFWPSKTDWKGRQYL
jgi:cellulose synthase/poly-beta-1,6-N-acetylglucosamine synthase-like glycosyltransferase